MLGKVRMIGTGYELGGGRIFPNNVLHDCAAFAEQCVSIFKQWRNFHWVQRFQLRRGKTRVRVAIVELQIIFEPQLLAQPDDPLGLRYAQVVDRKH